MKALTAVITRGGHDENTLVKAILDYFGKERMRGARWREFTSTDIDDMCALINGLGNSSHEIKLGAGG